MPQQLYIRCRGSEQGRSSPREARQTKSTSERRLSTSTALEEGEAAQEADSRRGSAPISTCLPLPVREAGPNPPVLYPRSEGAYICSFQFGLQFASRSLPCPSPCPIFSPCVHS